MTERDVRLESLEASSVEWTRRTLVLAARMTAWEEGQELPPQDLDINSLRRVLTEWERETPGLGDKVWAKAEAIIEDRHKAQREECYKVRTPRGIPWDGILPLGACFAGGIGFGTVMGGALWTGVAAFAIAGIGIVANAWMQGWGTEKAEKGAYARMEAAMERCGDENMAKWEKAFVKEIEAGWPKTTGGPKH